MRMGVNTGCERDLTSERVERHGGSVDKECETKIDVEETWVVW